MSRNVHKGRGRHRTVGRVGTVSAAAASVVAFGVLSACGSDAQTKQRPLPSPPKPSGEAAKPAATIISDARTALLAARSVRIVGDFTGQGKVTPTASPSASASTPPQMASTAQRFDLRLARGTKTEPEATGTVTTVTTSATGKVTTVRLELLRVNDKLYLRGDKAYYAQIGPKAAAVAGRWLVLPASSDQALADLTDMDTLANGLGGASAVTNEGVQQVDGSPAAVVQTDTGALLYVANTGEPRPLQLQRDPSRPSSSAGSQSYTVLTGRLEFSGYDESVSVKAPPNAIDLATLRR